MLKYVMTALALKLFSASPQMRKMYRLLGNTLGARCRLHRSLPENYVKRAKQILELCEKHSTIKKGYRLLELGTGWVHWESTVIRLFYDVEIYLFDVWDNRQLAALNKYFEEFKEIIDKEIDIDPTQRERVHGLLETV